MNIPSNPDLPTWTRPPATKAHIRNDTIMAAVLFGAAAFSMVLYGTSGMIPDPLAPQDAIWLLLALCAPLALRRRYPLTVLCVVSALFALNRELMVAEFLIQDIVLFGALYTAGAWAANRKAAYITRLTIIVLIFAWLIISLLAAATDPEHLSDFSPESVGWGLSPLLAYSLIQMLTNALYFGGAYYFGNHVWHSVRSRARLEFSNYQIQSQRHLLDLQAVELERMRLARELHDSVAHHVAMMGVQAGAALAVLDTKPTLARAALNEIETSAHSAVTELQGVVRTLRDTPVPDFDFYYDDDGPTWAQQLPPTEAAGAQTTSAKAPGNEGDSAQDALASIGIHAIPELVEKHRTLGLPAELKVVGEAKPVALSPVNDLNLYRICQEALTNVRKHAPSATQVSVVLRHLTEGVEIEVTNSASRGRAKRDGLGSGGGFGLIGMQERVAASGGQLQAGTLTEGGFQVRALLPYDSQLAATGKKI